ncbi:MAG: polysaccharide deacetylase family protein [Kiritimatiellae bacterium]|nr:polysaccharide deacetylase family protein [Kiritimatiellia bacterium]
MPRRLRNAIKDLCLHRPFGRFLCWRVPSSRARGRVALTFDDGPHPRYTPEVLAILERAGVRATFFLLAAQIEANRELAAAIAARQHEIAIHGDDHSPARLPAQIRKCAQTLAPDIAHSSRVRPPGGILSARAALWALWHGYTIVLWSFDARDSMRHEGKWAQRDVDYSRIAPGDIILMHDDNPVCVRELEGLIDGLRREGVEPGSVRELLAAAGWARARLSAP